jgi:hypothetical protein
LSASPRYLGGCACRDGKATARPARPASPATLQPPAVKQGSRAMAGQAAFGRSDLTPAQSLSPPPPPGPTWPVAASRRGRVARAVGVARGHSPSPSGSPAASIASHSARASSAASRGGAARRRRAAARPPPPPPPGPSKGKRASTRSPGVSSSAPSSATKTPPAYCRPGFQFDHWSKRRRRPRPPPAYCCGGGWGQGQSTAKK